MMFTITKKWEVREVTTCGHVQANYEEYKTGQFIMEDDAKSQLSYEPQWIRNVKTYIMSRPEWAVIYILGSESAIKSTHAE